jgi:phosphoribosylanthranilate isomerase
MCKVKICGIRSIHEGKLVDRLGAHALGLLVGQVHRSPDFISPELALEICSAVSPLIVPVLVTHLEDPGKIISLATALHCPVIQLHSDFAPKAVKELSRHLHPKKIIAKVSVEGEASIERAIQLTNCADALVLDSIDRSTNRVGGTGLVHDWRISARIARQSQLPIVLAGGLTPDNVGLAISTVRPWAVDVNSGVEAPDGDKSEQRLRAFMEAIRTTNARAPAGYPRGDT